MSALAQVSSYHIDTIRVEPQKLDALIAQVGELTVTRLRITRQIAEIEKILTLWEECSRDTNSQNSANNSREREQARNLHNGNLQLVQNSRSSSQQQLEQLGVLVNQLKNTASENTARLESVAGALESGIRTLRLLPLSTIFNLFPRMVRDLAKQQGKEINLVIEGEQTTADKRILEEIKDPLLHIFRNAIDHGIELPADRERLGKPRSATIRLRGYQSGSTLGIEVIDDGRGLDFEAIKRTALQRGICREEELAAMSTAEIQSLIFRPGFSTRTEVTEISGRGVGLDVVRANIERLKGSIDLESTPGMGCAFRIQLNTTLTTTYVLIVEVNQIAYAIPAEFVQTILLLSPQEIFTVEGNQTITLEGQPVSVASLADILELPLNVPTSLTTADLAAKTLSCLIMKVGSDRFGLLIDAVVDEMQVVLKPQSKLIKRIYNFTGATILSTGEVCMVLNPQDLLKSVQQQTRSQTVQQFIEQAEAKKAAILLVDDSIPIRTQLKRILESEGYEVTIAFDGLDGFNKLRAGTFDAVVSDVQMPNLDGLGLTARIRQHQEYRELPIILVTTLATEEDKRRGAEVGANAYITKGNFDQTLLLDALRRLV